MASQKPTVFPADTKHAKYDASTGLFSSATYPQLAIPDDLTIDQFMFDFTPSQASQSSGSLQGHVRPALSESRPWLIDGLDPSRSYTASGCRRRTAQLAQVFHSHLGLEQDGVVCIYSPNDVDYPLAIWAAFRLGAIVSGANPSYTQDELAYQLEVLAKTHPLKAFVTHPAALEVALKAAEKAKFPKERILLVGGSKPSSAPSGILTFDEAISKFAPDPEKLRLPERQKLGKGEARKKLAFLSFSSGTTGLPKAVCIPHLSVVSNVIQYGRGLDGKMEPGAKVLAVLPFYHIYGLVVVLHAAIYLGASVVVFPKFDFVPLLDSIISLNISSLYLVPPMIVLLTKHPAVGENGREEKLKGVMKDIMVGAAPLTEELVTVFRKRFPHTDIGQGYGLTETSTVISMPPRMAEPTPGASAGVICPNVQIKILSEDGKKLGWGETGEVCSKSPSNASGYLNNEKATNETFIDGFVHTGDEGYVDEKGWLYIVDRRKELIKVKGNQVAPAELEGHLLGHPDVSDACVIGVPDEYSGEAPRAYIVPSAGAAKRIKGNESAAKELEESIKKWVADKKIKYKHLTGGVEFTDAIPKNPSGKLLRRQLRDQYKAKTKKSKL